MLHFVLGGVKSDGLYVQFISVILVNIVKCFRINCTEWCKKLFSYWLQGVQKMPLHCSCSQLYYTKCWVAFSQVFRCENWQQIYSKTIIRDATTPLTRCCSTLCSSWQFSDDFCWLLGAHPSCYLWKFI